MTIETNAGLECIIERWYSAEKNYDYKIQEGKQIFYSFTQIIWQSTKYIGFSSKTFNSGITVFVAFYWPPGNIQGLYQENVLPKPVLADNEEFEIRSTIF